MTDLVIYHGGCTDGVAAAYAVYQKLPDARYWPGVYQNSPPWDMITDVAPGERIYLVDFSYKRPMMEKIYEHSRGDCCALRMVPHAPGGTGWHGLMRKWERFIEKGEQAAIQQGTTAHKYFRTLVDQAKTWAFSWMIDDIVMPVVNAPY